MGMRLSVPQREDRRPTRQVTVLKYWAYFQHEMLFICWGVMDVALLTPFALSILPWTRYWPPALFFFFLLLLMLLSFNLTRLMSALQLRPSIQQSVTAISLTLLVIICVRTLGYSANSIFDMSWLGQSFHSLNTLSNFSWLRDIIFFFLIVLMWARGIQMADRFFTIDRIGLRLRVGGLLLAPFIIWVANRSLLWSAVPFILLFFLAGLTAVALTRAEEISREETGFSASQTPRWLLIILAAGLLIVLSGGLIALIISGEAGNVLAGVLGPIWLAIKITGSTILLTIAYLMQPFFYILEFLFVRLPASFGFLGEWFYLTFVFFAKIIGKLFRPDDPSSEEVSSPSGLFQFPAADSPNIELSLGLNGQIIIILLALALIFAVALMLRRRYTRTAVADRTALLVSKTGTAAEVRENLLQRFMGKLGWRRWHTAASIRRIYKRMMQAAAEIGYPKLESETPYEYLPTLDKAWPANPVDIRLITEAYVKIRYGELPETAEELNEIRSAWQHLLETRPSSPQK